MLSYILAGAKETLLFLSSDKAVEKNPLRTVEKGPFLGVLHSRNLMGDDDDATGFSFLITDMSPRAELFSMTATSSPHVLDWARIA